MNKPLSYRSYFFGNKKLVISYIFTLVICMSVLGISKMIVNNPKMEQEENLELLKYCSIVSIVNKGKEADYFLRAIKKLPEVKKVVPIGYKQYSYQTYLSDIEYQIYYMDRNTMIEILKNIDSKIEEKQIPRSDRNEVLVSKRIMISEKLTLGSRLKVDHELICRGSIDTKATMCFCPTTVSDKSVTYLLLPKEGQREKMNQAVLKTKNSNVKFKYLERYMAENKSMDKRLNETLNIACALVTFVFSIMIACITYVHYSNRKVEMGILRAIGYSLTSIVGRMTQEILISSGIAAGMALILIKLFIMGMNQFIMKPNGYLSLIITGEILRMMVFVPLILMTFSIIPIWILLKTTNQITIIEGGE